MKVTLLSLVLLCGACQSTDAGPVRSIHPSPVMTVPAAVVLEDAAPITKVLPRRIHLDRSRYAVRMWVRDRS